MHPKALKSRILATYANVAREPGFVAADWDVVRDYDYIRCEDVARWLIDHAPDAWAVWCYSYQVRFDYERDEFIDLREWGFRLALQDAARKSWDDYRRAGSALSDRLDAMIDPNPKNWSKRGQEMRST